MPEHPSKASGNIDSAMGTVKQNVGSAFGNKEMEAKGAAQRASGNTEFETAKAAGRAQGSKDKLYGTGQEWQGKVTGDESVRVYI